jgi:hypothetical protein
LPGSESGFAPRSGIVDTALGRDDSVGDREQLGVLSQQLEHFLVERRLVVR